MTQQQSRKWHVRNATSQIAAPSRRWCIGTEPAPPVSVATYLRSPINGLTHKIIGCAIEVHRYLGAGLLETVYQRCLQFELKRENLAFTAGQMLPVVYKTVHVGVTLRIDLWIESLVIVELKAVQEIAPIHTAQLLTYLKLTGAPVGLIINFNVPVLRGGVQRMLNADHTLGDGTGEVSHAKQT